MLPLLINECREMAGKSNQDDYGNENANTLGFMNKLIALHVHHTCSGAFCSRIRKKRDSGYHLNKKAQNLKKKTVYAISFAKASEDVGCRSRRRTFFLLILVSLSYLATCSITT